MHQPLHQFKAEFFKALAHPARLVILEQLRSGEKCVTDLQAVLNLEQSRVSQHLALLRHRHIVDMRKEGTMIYYRVHSPLIFSLLDVARTIFQHQLTTTQGLLMQLQDETQSISDAIATDDNEQA